MTAAPLLPPSPPPLLLLLLLPRKRHAQPLIACTICMICSVYCSICNYHCGHCAVELGCCSRAACRGGEWSEGLLGLLGYNYLLLRGRHPFYRLCQKPISISSCMQWRSGGLSGTPHMPPSVLRSSFRS